MQTRTNTSKSYTPPTGLFARIRQNIRERWRCFKKGHDYEFVRSIYGDEINQVGGMRSEWKCIYCGKWNYRP
ncbi:hypothetical protein, partial [Escherichia coli]|uniref:hypothetical protein n=1 Tax=Escherichia coli TaxID=562 RepID=UPI00112FA73F